MDLATNQGIKVLRAGASWHGGEHNWSLPTRATDGAWTPGEWTPAVAPSMCSRGWHLTTEPGRWWSGDVGVVAYLAEWDGALARREDDEKFAVERCRLLRALTADELATFGVFLSGIHEVRAGSATDSATVTATGSATVTAYDSATVTAYGSATVTAYGSATVTAYDSATVTAYGSATVTAYGSATVTAYGSATVSATGSATVTAYDSAKAHAAGCSTATAWSRGVVATRADLGVIVDRRGNTPRTVCKRGGLDGWRYADGDWVLSARVAE